MQRRHFLRQRGAVTAGGLLLSNTPFAKFMSSKTEKIKLGIIGCGDRGSGVAGIAASLPEKFDVVAVCDILPFRLAAIKKTIPAAKEYKDYRSLLDDKSVDAVVIATPLNMHYPVAADALKAGKQLYLEKTMTYNIEQAIALVKLSKEYKGQVVQVGHQYRYSPLYFKVKEMIKKGYLGKVVQIDCRWDRNWNWRRPVPAGLSDRQINWRMYKEYSGGLVAELLSHQIDFINWAFDTHPDEIYATGGIDFFKDGRETYDNVQALFRYGKADMIGNFGATCGNAHDGYLFKLKGTKGSVHLLIDEGVFYPEKDQKKSLETVDGVTGATKITWNKDGSIPILPEPTKDGTWYALNEFYDCVQQKKLPYSNIITGATTAVCVHLANKALYSQTIQKWNAGYDFIA